MRKSLIDFSDYWVSVAPDETEQVIAYFEEHYPARPRKKPIRHDLACNRATYLKAAERFNLLPPAIIEQVIASGELVPDFYRQDEPGERAVPYFEHAELVAVALEKGLVSRCERILHKMWIAAHANDLKRCWH